MRKVKKIKRKTLTQVKKELDRVFSIFIRQRDKGICFTCDVQKPWKEMQAGHYISRASMSLRFDERNVNCQCMPCNVWKHGAMDVYALKLQAKYGDSILADLQRMKHQLRKYSVEEMEKLVLKYKTLIY